jgi:tetratricopeptide (TPR) repeat protein
MREGDHLAIRELVEAGDERRRRGDLAKAEALLRRAVLVAESGGSDLDAQQSLPNALNALGLLCKDLARHDEARALYERALGIVELSPAPREDDLATLYHNLGGIEHARRDFAAAEPLARRGVALRRKLGDDDAIASDLVALAAILDGRRNFDEAEILYLEALSILERSPERNAGEIAVALNNLGAHYLARGRMTEALSLLTRAERLKRTYLHEGHPDIAVTLNNLAEAQRRRGELVAAKHSYRQAVEIFEARLGAEHPKTAACRRNLSTLENDNMSTNDQPRAERATVRIDLTADQKQVVKAATDRDAEAIELTVEELESRIAPSGVTGGGLAWGRLAGNHNETFVDSAS